MTKTEKKMFLPIESSNRDLITNGHFIDVAKSHIRRRVKGHRVTFGVSNDDLSTDVRITSL